MQSSSSVRSRRSSSNFGLGSADAADQIERAASSIVQNVAEGSLRRGKDPRRFYTMANGSASEVRAVLDLAKAWGWPINDAEARRLLDRELALLWGLTRGTSKS